MDGDVASNEEVPMTPLNGQSTDENGETEKSQDTGTAPASPTPSQESAIENSLRKRSKTVAIDVPGDDVPLEKKTVTHEHSLSLLNQDINSMLPDSMRIPIDTTNGGDDKNQNIDKTNKSTDAPDGFNQYRNQKSFSQGMLDIALFTSNVNQLRAVTKNPPANVTFNFCFVIFLLVFSVLLQIAVGLVLLLSARYNVNKEDERKTVYKMGNYVVSGIFLITILNLFIAVFYDYDNSVP